MLGLLEKNQFRKFLLYLSQYDENDSKTWKGAKTSQTKWKKYLFCIGKDLRTMSMRSFCEAFGLSKNTQSFVGHAMALHTDDQYLDKPAIDTVAALKLYVYSFQRHGRSPYIYPCYGLGGLPEGFSRLCAIHGGTFMLQCPVEKVLFGDDGKAWGIQAGNQVLCSLYIILAADREQGCKSRCYSGKSFLFSRG